MLNGMVLIPGGTFQMGIPKDSLHLYPDNLGMATAAIPIHTVTLDSFWIDTIEVTESFYANIMGIPLSKISSSNLPVNDESWFDAILFCNQRSKKENKDTVYKYQSLVFKKPTLQSIQDSTCIRMDVLSIDYSKNGYRLPTEAEWEYACQGGVATRDFFGNRDPARYIWFPECYIVDGTPVEKGGDIMPVAQKEPNQYNLYDMYGNVREWCNDWDSAYDSVPQIDPTGSEAGTFRICRGGCCRMINTMGSRLRDSHYPYVSGVSIGFRCCLAR
jgi:formylglycine-generating enzyme required for sulfatase activity